MPIGAVAAAGSGITSLVGGLLGSGASSAATQAAQQANQTNQANYLQTLNTTSANEQPYIGAGSASINELEGLEGIGGNAQAAGSALQNYLGSTNYQFQLNQGEQATTYANAGAFDSSATQKALNNYAQGQAASALSGYEGLLTGQSSLGQGAATQLGQISTNINQGQASSNNNLASVEGQSAYTNANAITSALSGVNNAVSGGLAASSFGSSTPTLSSTPQTITPFSSGPITPVTSALGDTSSLSLDNATPSALSLVAA